MAFELHRTAFPALVASQPIAARQAVKLTDGERGIAPCTTVADVPHGIALEGASQIGAAVTVHDRGNYVKVVAAASLGGGVEIGCAGATTSLGLAAGASGSVRVSVGQSVGPAAAGETFTLYVNPRVLSGAV